MNHPALETEKRGVSKFMLGLIGQPLKQAKSETNQRPKKWNWPLSYQRIERKVNNFFHFFFVFTQGYIFCHIHELEEKKVGEFANSHLFPFIDEVPLERWDQKEFHRAHLMECKSIAFSGSWNGSEYHGRVQDQ